MSQERNHELAAALQALDDLAVEKKEYMLDHNKRVEEIKNQVRVMARNILTGQGQLPLEVGEEFQEMAAKVGEQLRQ